MEKKTFNYILIAILAVALALFIGLWVGNNKKEDDNRVSYTPPTIVDNREDGIKDPSTGSIADATDYDGEVYNFSPNGTTYNNYEYFVNNNQNLDNDSMFLLAQKLFDSTYASDLISSSFITVGKYDGTQTSSSLVYIKFSTYLGKYNGNDLVSVTPALVMFGFEQTVDNQYYLRYAFCTYGDRGEVYSGVKFFKAPGGDSFIPSLKFRVPYLLTSNYEEVISLFSLNGLVKEGVTYKLLNNDGNQYYIESNVLNCIASLTKFIVSDGLSSSFDTHYLYGINLTDYFVVVGQDFDYCFSDYGYIKYSSILNETGIYEYYTDVSHNLFTFYSLYSWFNNENSIYNVPLVNVSV